MTYDDLIFVFLLFVSLCLGPMMQRSRGLRLILSPLLGFCMAFAAIGLSIWHSIATVIGFIILMNLCRPKFIHYVAVLWCFGYLAFFRTCHHFAFAQTPPMANAVQLIITLRLIGVAFEIVDSNRVDHRLAQPNEKSCDTTERERLRLVKQFKNVNVSSLDVIYYAYCYIGLFTGPYYKYRTFQDFVNWPVFVPISTSQLIQRLRQAVVFGISYFTLSHFFTIDYFRTAEFYERPLPYRLFCLIITCLVYRLRFYSAWKVAESVCITAGLGAYPLCSEPISGEGPTNLRTLQSWVEKHNLDTDVKRHTSNDNTVRKSLSCSPVQTATTTPDRLYDFSTIENIDVWGCEFAPTIRERMRLWNRSVQYWLLTNFNKRCPGNRLIRNAWTMLISAYWHGFHPGYYLSFLIFPLVLKAESSAAYVQKNTFAQHLPDSLLTFLAWIIKMRVMEYCLVGFLLLDAETTLACWQSFGYWVHILLLGMCGIGFLVSWIRPGMAYKLRHKAVEEKKRFLNN